MNFLNTRCVQTLVWNASWMELFENGMKDQKIDIVAFSMKTSTFIWEMEISDMFVLAWFIWICSIYLYVVIFIILANVVHFSRTTTSNCCITVSLNLIVPPWTLVLVKCHNYSLLEYTFKVTHGMCKELNIYNRI